MFLMKKYNYPCYSFLSGFSTFSLYCSIGFQLKEVTEPLSSAELVESSLIYTEKGSILGKLLPYESYVTLFHSEWPKFYRVLVILTAIGLTYSFGHS